MKCKRPSCNNDVPEQGNRQPKALYCSRQCKSVEAVNRLRRKRKAECVQYKGGKCEICGYNKSLAALQFHHLDPSTKEFQVNRRMTFKFSDVKPELDKCILVCANCHAELHESQ